MEFSRSDKKFMKAAIRLGQRGRGFTEPNPLVGAVVVKNNRIISTGFHRAYGKEHAEAAALKGVRQRDATLFVPLEPCNHHGKQPPCCDLIIQKNVGRVVIAAEDPCPLVKGRGIKRLLENGIRVDEGCLREMYAGVNRHYFTFMNRQRPYVALNAGVSMDGKLTDKYRKSQWVTDDRLREYSHSLRGEFSSILVGVKTVLDDDPQLTVREKAWGGKSLYRIVLDSHNIMGPHLRVFREQDRFPLAIFSSRDAQNKIKKVDNHFFVGYHQGGLHLDEILEKLAAMGIASVLVEGGGGVLDSFLEKKLYDEIILFVADKIIGGKESVQLFSSGAPLGDAVVLKEREILAFDTGYMVRGY